MKKSLIFVGMLAIGFANAQEGNVGINTDQPKATLDIQPNATNLAGTTNQGILAPRLSKVRVANIETPVQGTLVYVLDENSTEYPNSLISAYTGADNKVAKITEKGYYFYNGTEWVRVQYKDTNDAEWVYDDVTKRINLKRSGIGDFKNSVFYDVKGYSYDIEKTSYQTKNFITNVVETVDVLNSGNAKVNNRLSSSIPTSPNLIANTYKPKRLVENSIFMQNEGTSSQDRVAVNENKLLYGEDVTTDTYMGIGAIGSISNESNANLRYAIGLNGSVDFKNTTSSTGYVWGNRGYAATTSSGKISRLSAFGGYVNANGSGSIENMRLFDGIIQFGGNLTSEITNVHGINIITELYGNHNAKVENLRGFYYKPNLVLGKGSTIKNHYGIFVENINSGTETNYSIYTNEGNVRLGALKGTGDRLVYTDENGVLKAGISSLTSKWSNDATNNLIKIANLSDGITVREDSKNLLITDDGRVGIGLIPDPKYKLEVPGTSKVVDVESTGWITQKLKQPVYHQISNGDLNSSFLFNHMWSGAVNDYAVLTNDGTSTYAGQFSFRGDSGQLGFRVTNKKLDSGQAISANDWQRLLVMDGNNRNVRIGNVANTYQENQRSLVVEHENGSIGVYKNNGATENAELGKIDLGVRVGGLYETVASIKTISDKNAYVGNGQASQVGGALTFSTAKLTNNIGNDQSLPEEHMRITSAGNIGIGTTVPTEKLEVDGKIKASSLAQSGAGDRVVYADENGVLKTGVSAAANVKLATANNVECTEANTGTMNFGSVTINGKATEAFGFCMKNSTGEYKWYYIYGGAGITTGSGAFGSNL